MCEECSLTWGRLGHLSTWAAAASEPKLSASCGPCHRGLWITQGDFPPDSVCNLRGRQMEKEVKSSYQLVPSLKAHSSQDWAKPKLGARN